jgi:neopullulanase
MAADGAGKQSARPRAAGDRIQDLVSRRSHHPFFTASVLLAPLLVLAAGCTWSVAGSSAEARRQGVRPQVTKLDPPNWWTGFTANLEILATGRNLAGATVRCSYAGVSIVRTKVTDGGHYLFVWLKIDASTPPGDALLDVRMPSGGMSVAFPLRRRSSPAGSFQGFSDDDVIYLIMPDRFADGDPSNNEPAGAPGSYDRANPRAYHGGDLQGIRDHLDYLRELGVTTIWLTPIVENDPASPQDYHGYGAVDEYAVEQHFGTLKDLQALVHEAHEKNLKVILDFVPNHVGPHHPWVAEPPEPDWFHGTNEHHSTSNGDFQFLADPHAPPRYWRDVVDGWFAGILPDLNQENPDVAQYFIENALWWAEETGIDGYRLDTFPYVSRRFWSQWHEALRAVYPRMTTVGEVFNSDPVITSFFVGGHKGFDGIDTGVTTVFDFPLFDALRGVLSDGASMQTIVDVLSRDRLFPHPDLLVPFLGNHDVPRLASLPGMSDAKSKLAFSLLLTTRGIPEIYYGDEIGMTGGGDPDNRHDFPGGFPDDEQNAFVESGRTPEQQELFARVQRLLALRRDHAALRRGQLWNIFWNKTVYAFARTFESERILIVANAAGQAQDAELSFAETPLSAATDLISILGSSEQPVQNDRVKVALPADGVQIYLVK